MNKLIVQQGMDLLITQAATEAARILDISVKEALQNHSEAIFKMVCAVMASIEIDRRRALRDE